MARLTNHQRAILTNLWIKRERPGDVETFIKRVCAQKGIEYQPNNTRRPERVKRLKKPVAQSQN